MNSNLRAILGLDDVPPRETTRNRRGVMSYGHKTGGSIEIFTNESWEKNKKYYVANGARSCVKNFLRG